MVRANGLTRRGPEPLTEDQKRLAAENFGLAYKAADLVMKNAPPYIDRDDLAQAATFALFRAAKRFDPTRGWKFSTYATRSCIREAAQELERQTRRQTRKVAEVQWCQTDYGCQIDPAAPAAAEDTLEIAEAWAALDGLDPRERMVVVHRNDGVTCRQLGELLSLTRERVRQIELKAMVKLRTRLASRS